MPDSPAASRLPMSLSNCRLPIGNIFTLDSAIANRQLAISSPCGREDYFKRGTHSHLAVKAHFSTVKLHCPKHLCQAYTGPALLGGVIKIEDSLLIFPGDSYTPIDHHYSHSVVGAARSGYLQ